MALYYIISAAVSRKLKRRCCFRGFLLISSHGTLLYYLSCSFKEACLEMMFPGVSSHLFTWHSIILSQLQFQGSLFGDDALPPLLVDDVSGGFFSSLHMTLYYII